VIIKLTAFSFAAVIFIVYICIWVVSSKSYTTYVNVLSNKEFRLRRFLPAGLYLLDRFSYTFNTNYDRNLQYKLSEVYGQEYSLFYLHIFHAKKITVFIMFIISEFLITSIKGLNQTVFIYILIIFGILFFIDDSNLNKKVYGRRLEIQLRFPEFINKLSLLLNAGLTMSKAWEKISNDNQNKSEFYNEVTKTVIEIQSGKNESEAYSDFAKRLKSPEISRLISTIIQNTKRGGNDLVLTLRLQSAECWEMRKNAIKKLGEEASTKLLFPMVIMFLAIILIVVLPAILSMKGITNNF
jgi:tight adherence protein C